jgi:hypothetical protein
MRRVFIVLRWFWGLKYRKMKVCEEWHCFRFTNNFILISQIVLFKEKIVLYLQSITGVA